LCADRTVGAGRGWYELFSCTLVNTINRVSLLQTWVFRPHLSRNPRFFVFPYIPLATNNPVLCQMPAVEARGQRIRRMSNRKRRALGLPSDDEGSSEQEEQPEDDGDDGGAGALSAPQGSVASPAPSIPPMPEAPSLEWSQSTASLASQASGTVSTTVTAEEARRIKFDARFNTATSTNEEVLGKFHYVFNPIFSLIFQLQRGRWLLGPRQSTNISECHPLSLSRKEWSSISILASRTYFII